MPTIVPISDFRADIFKFAKFIQRTGQPVTITSGSNFILKVLPVKDEMAERAAYALKYVLPKIDGAWADIPDKEFKRWRKSLRALKAERKFHW